VLAAALIFAMVVTVLIGTSSAGVRMSGISATRLEANLIAEQELVRIETLLNAKRTPPEDSEETRDPYLVRVYSEPAIGDLGGGLAPGPDGGGLSSILALEAPGLDQFLLRYEIRVEWIEATGADSVRRTTYAFDWEGARAALPDLFQAGPGGEEDPSDPEDPDRESGESADGPGRQLPQLPSLGGR
jgi:hypothetical protein